MILSRHACLPSSSRRPLSTEPCLVILYTLYCILYTLYFVLYTLYLLELNAANEELLDHGELKALMRHRDREEG